MIWFQLITIIGCNSEATDTGMAQMPEDTTPAEENTVTSTTEEPEAEAGTEAGKEESERRHHEIH